MLEVNNKVADKEELESKLKKQIAKRNIPMISDSDVVDDSPLARIGNIKRDLNNVNRHLSIMEASWQLKEDDLKTTKKHFKRTRRLFKKIVRKFTRFLFRNIYEQQSDFNNSALKAIQNLNIAINELLKEITELEESLRNED